MPEIIIERVDSRVLAPTRVSYGSAGYDLYAWLFTEGHVTLRPGERRLISTGLRMQIPPGWEAQIRPRSGLALKKGLTVLNTPGTIDSDYRGEIGVVLVNMGAEDVSIDHNDRIAQMVFAPTYRVTFQDGVVVNNTGRGAGGFGSTGA